MTATTADAVRAFILDFVSDGLRAKRLEPSEVDDSFDLLMEGAIDSFGILELIGELDRRFGVAIDVTEVDVDTLTTVGPLAHHVASIAADA